LILERGSIARHAGRIAAFPVVPIDRDGRAVQVDPSEERPARMLGTRGKAQRAEHARNREQSGRLAPSYQHAFEHVNASALGNPTEQSRKASLVAS
jgi:hypothetical protein